MMKCSQNRRIANEDAHLGQRLVEPRRTAGVVDLKDTRKGSRIMGAQQTAGQLWLVASFKKRYQPFMHSAAAIPEALIMNRACYGYPAQVLLKGGFKEGARHGF